MAYRLTKRIGESRFIRRESCATGRNLAGLGGPFHLVVDGRPCFPGFFRMAAMIAFLIRCHPGVKRHDIAGMQMELVESFPAGKPQMIGDNDVGVSSRRMSLSRMVRSGPRYPFFQPNRSNKALAIDSFELLTHAFTFFKVQYLDDGLHREYESES